MTEATSSKSRLKLLIGVPLLIVAMVVGEGLIFRGEYTTEQTATRTFEIDMDFTKLRKILVRTNATKEIITMGGDSEFVSQHWNEAQIDTGGERLGKALLKSVFSHDPTWGLDLKGTMKVRTLDSYIGQNVITLEQNVQVRPDFIDSRVSLQKGSERLVDYKMHTRFSREKEKSLVELTLTQGIKTDAPWFAHGIADRRVKASAERALENQERATKKLVEENADKAGFFPLN